MLHHGLTHWRWADMAPMLSNEFVAFRGDYHAQ